MSQPHDYGTEDVRKMVTLAVRDMVWFDQTTGDPKAFLPLAEKIVEHVTKNLCGAPEGWDVDAVDRQYEKLRELVGNHADADIRCAVANLRNANRILRLGGYYTSTGQRDDVMRWSGRGPDPRLDELLDDLEKAAEYRATMVGENAEGDHVFESGVMIVDARNAIYEYLRSHPADNAAGGQYEAWTAYINSPDHGSSRRDAFLAGWQSARHQPVESGQQNQQGDEREIVARWLWEHDDEVSDGSMQDASWDAATDMRAGYYAAADDLLARLAGLGQFFDFVERVKPHIQWNHITPDQIGWTVWWNDLGGDQHLHNGLTLRDALTACLSVNGHGDTKDE